MDQLSKIDAKLDRLQEDMSDVKTTMAVNTASLVEHIKRTNLLEDAIKPIQSHVNRVETMVKLVVSLAAIAAFLKEMGVL